MAKKATKTTTRKTQTQKRGDQTPEAKATTSAKQKAAEDLFQDADRAALTGLPPEMTKEQRENQVRRAALGY